MSLFKFYLIQKIITVKGSYHRDLPVDKHKQQQIEVIIFFLS